MALFRGTLWLCVCVCVYAIAKRLNNLIIVGTCERLIRKLVLVTTEVTIIIAIIIIMWKQQQQQHKPHERHLSLRIEYEDGREEDDEINPFEYVANPKTPYCLEEMSLERFRCRMSCCISVMDHNNNKKRQSSSLTTIRLRMRFRRVTASLPRMQLHMNPKKKDDKNKDKNDMILRRHRNSHHWNHPKNSSVPLLWS